MWIWTNSCWHEPWIIAWAMNWDQAILDQFSRKLSVTSFKYMIFHKNEFCLARYFFEVLSPPSPNIGVLGKLGPCKSSPRKLGPSLIWQQIGPHTLWCRGRLGPGKSGPGQLDPCIIYSFVLNIYCWRLGDVCHLDLYIGFGYILQTRDICPMEVSVRPLGAGLG